ncbi:MAG TPA: hypothetical protein VIU33_00150 [Nitrospiria bacterium]
MIIAQASSREPDSTSGEPRAPANPEPSPNPGETPGQEESSEAQKALEQTAEEAEKSRTVTSDVEQAMVLIGENRLQVEVTETYAHFSSNQLFIDGFAIVPIFTVGDINIERIRRDIFITQFAARYRMTNRLQLELRIPYSIIFARTSIAAQSNVEDAAIAPSEETFAKSAGMGDIETTASFQLLTEQVGRPGILVGLGLRLRTGRDFFETSDPVSDPPIGSGYNGLIGSISLVKTADPAVLFGSLSYVKAFPRNDVLFLNNETSEAFQVDFDPGDSIRWGMGLAYALNFRLTLSLQFSQAITFPSHLDGRKNINSFGNAISMRIGGVWRVNDITSIDVGASPGFSLDAPDIRFDIRVPYRF